MKPKKLEEMLEELGKKIDLIRLNSPLSERVALDYDEVKRHILLHMSFMSHRWAILKRYPRNNAEWVEIKADTLDEALEKATEALDDKDVVAVELYCDGRKVDEV